jgi:SAM-dependent methyltransferase
MSSSGPVAESNLAMAESWDGDGGAFWAKEADHFERSGAAYDADLFEMAAIEAGSVVLDIGCGTGVTTREAARRAPQGRAIGVDLSRQMLEVARTRAVAAGLDNVEFVQADAQVHPFDPVHDRLISRTGVMFFGEREAAFANLASALTPEARVALLVWRGFGENDWMREITGALMPGRPESGPPPDAPSPFALADRVSTTALLEGAGFRDVRFHGVEHPLVFGADADEAHAFLMGLSGWMIAELDDAARAAASERLRAMLEAHAGPTGLALASAAWLITARR